MALELIDYPYFRSDTSQRLTITEIDSTGLLYYNLSLASYNSLQYRSQSFNVESSNDLGGPFSTYFNSRNLPGPLAPFDNGSTFVFNFSEQSYGPGASGPGATANTYNWWKSFDLVTDDVKIITISEIGKPGNYWEFRLNNLSYQIGTSSNFWRVNANKALGPTFGGAVGYPYAFSVTASYLISYRTYGMSGGNGPSASIGGTIEGSGGQFYTYFNNEPISNRLFLGDLTYPLPIGASGSSASGGTNSLVSVGGSGVIANRMYLGDLTYPLPIGASGSSASGGTNSLVSIGGSGVVTQRIFLGDLTYPLPIGVTGGTMTGTNSIVEIGGLGISSKNIFLGDTINYGKVRFSGATGTPPIDVVYRVPRQTKCRSCDGEYCSCFLGDLTNWFRSEDCPCNGSSQHAVNGLPNTPGTVGPVDDIQNQTTTTSLSYVDSVSDYLTNINVGGVLIGNTSSDMIGLVSLPRYSRTLSSYQPDLMLYIGRGETTSHSRESYQVGVGVYNVSTSYLEISSVTYSSPTSSNYKPTILLSGHWGNTSSASYSILSVDSDAISVNKLIFGTAGSTQTLDVVNGDLLVNNVVSNIQRVAGYTIAGTRQNLVTTYPTLGTLNNTQGSCFLYGGIAKLDVQSLTGSNPNMVIFDSFDNIVLQSSAISSSGLVTFAPQGGPWLVQGDESLRIGVTGGSVSSYILATASINTIKVYYTYDPIDLN
jgi:hypothetical protein